MSTELKKIFFIAGPSIILVFIIIALNIRIVLDIPSAAISYVKEKNTEIKQKNERKKMIVAYGGQEKVDELYKNSILFCLDETDCVFQENQCCSYKIVNKYNYKADQYKGGGNCFNFCLPTKLICSDNECVLVEQYN